MNRFSDLREILRYVPSYRDRVFVIAVDGELIEDERFPKLLLDIALLRSLNIQVVLVHGAGFQINRLAAELKVTASNADGTGVTDEPTLRLALTAINRVTHELLEGLSAVDLRGASTNALVAHPAGILKGVDMQFTGKIERIEAKFLTALLQNNVVPVMPPLGFDGEGRTYRVNSDAVAAQVAQILNAVKLIYISNKDGVERNGKLLRQLPLAAAEDMLKKEREKLDAGIASKLEHAARACQGGVERVHIINGRADEGLLGEVFSPQGIGTLIHVNEYEAIRVALKKDARTIQHLIQHAVAQEEVLKRTRAAIEKQINEFYLFEIDRNPVACIALHPYAETGQAELACLVVHPSYENRGIGRKLVAFIERTAREKGFKELLTLSTQSFTFFQQKGGFQEAGPENLPPARRTLWEQSKRNSRILVKKLNGPTV